MDIVTFLINDHHRLREEMAAVHEGLRDPDLERKILTFLPHFRLHQHLEDEVLSKVNAAPGHSLPKAWTAEYKRGHRKLWILFHRLISAIRRRDSEAVEHSFLDFYHLADIHIRSEERILLPLVERALSPQVLERLGEKAKKQFQTARGLPPSALEDL